MFEVVLISMSSEIISVTYLRHNVMYIMKAISLAAKSVCRINCQDAHELALGGEEGVKHVLRSSLR